MVNIINNDQSLRTDDWMDMNLCFDRLIITTRSMKVVHREQVIILGSGHDFKMGKFLGENLFSVTEEREFP